MAPASAQDHPSGAALEAPPGAHEAAAGTVSFATRSATPASDTTSAPPPFAAAFPRDADVVEPPGVRPDIISHHLAEPSEALAPGEGIRLDVGFLATPDGLHLRTAHFRPRHGRIRNTFVFLPGKSAPIEGLQDQIEYIVRRGHQVLALDWRSQGLSSRTYRTDVVHVNDFASEYARDL